jgi:DNA-binding response OmpR family regulator
MDRSAVDGVAPLTTRGRALADGPDALILCGEPQTIGLLRALRAGEIPRGLTVDRDARTAHVDGRGVKLTRLEFDLFAARASEPRRTFTRAELTLVWDYEPQAAGPSGTVHSHIHSLRHKLEQAGAQEMVQTVRGVGWRLTR